MTLFDTDVIIWAIRGMAKAAAMIDAGQPCALSAVSYMEMLRGAHDAREARLIQKTLRNYGFHILPVTESVSAKAVSLIETFALSNGLDIADAFIFSTALDLDIPLCSGNEKHYKVVPGLNVKPFQP
jgi:predicted nucleic acid-binding protein